MIKNFAEVHKTLAGFVPKDAHGSYALDRIEDLMIFLGSPQEKFKTIHVAGTSGKTSTAYYIASMLTESGQKVGLTVSPHVDEVNERLQINLQPLAEQEYCKELNAFLAQIEGFKMKPTYFELLVAFAYWYFAKVKVDYAVVEVGLGGLLDGTNVIKSPDKICVITDIGYDHTSVLGATLEKIAFQKAGIIRPGNQVIMHQQEPTVVRIIEQKVKDEKAKLLTAVRNEHLGNNQMLWFQRRNWQLAYSVYIFLQQRDKLRNLNEQQLNRSMKTHIPARMEIVKYKGKTVIMDGAHNPQKLTALMRSIQQKFPSNKMIIVFGLLDGKDLEGSVRTLRPIAERIIATAFAAEQDMPRSSVPPEQIVAECEKAGIDAVIERDPKTALITAQNEGDIILIAGSFFLLNHIRPLILSSGD